MGGDVAMEPVANADERPLDAVVVIELATGVAGPYCGGLLASLGARVIKVEPPEGDESRRLGPFLDGTVDPERSATHLHLDRGKEGIVVDVATPDGADLVRRLLDDADVLVDSVLPEDRAAHGLDPDSLLVDHPALVVTTVTPFGASGPYRHMLASEVVLAAMGGPMSSRGRADREPLKLAGNVTQYQCGNVACTATLAALLHATTTGEGQHVDVGAFETQNGSIDSRMSYLLGYQYTGLVATRAATTDSSTRAPLPGGFFTAGDGGVVQIATLGNHLPKMLATLGDRELAAAIGVKGGIFQPEVQDRLADCIQGWLSSHTAREAMREAQAHGWPVVVVQSSVDILTDEHERTRGFFAEVEHPVAGTVTQLGAPWRFSRAAPEPMAPAPTLGQHTRGVLEALGLDAAAIDALGQAGVIR